MDDLIGEFITETSDSLSVLDSELIELEKNPNDETILSNIFRLVHTIKGTCGFLGLPRLESVAHAGENVLGKFREGELEVSPEGVSIVLEALDCIRDLVDYLAEHGEEPEGDDSDLINRLNAFAEGLGAGGEEGKAGDDAKGGEEEIDELQALFDATEVEEDFSPDSSDKDKEKSSKDDDNDEEEIDLETLVANITAEADALDDEEGEKGKEQEKDSALPAATTEAKKKNSSAKSSAPKEKKKDAVEKGLAATKKTAGAGGAGGGGGAATPNLANQSIRVNLGVLEKLMSTVGELVLTRNQLTQIIRNKNDEEFKAPLQRLSLITSELQEEVMKTRMQPIGNAWSKFPRLIRDLSIELNKKIELKMEGADTELDRQLLEMIKDPLTHMVRNSCDHGLESPEERIAANKPETGTVRLSAYHEGGHIIVEIADDGRGVNIEKVSQKIIENGLATEAELADMSDHQIMQYIFKAGFSTAAEVTSVSGRGVGMDVVRTNIESIGGTVDLDSEPGKGSVFQIKIPLTLAIVSVLVVEASKQRFAIPQINVLELVHIGKSSDRKVEIINNSPVLRLRDKLLPLISLSKILGLDDKKYNPDNIVKNNSSNDEEKTKGEAATEDEKELFETSYIIVCKVGATEYGLLVDAVYDTEEIVVKPTAAILQHLSIYSGNTVLGDGSVIMILDPNGIAKTIGSDLDGSRKEDSSTSGTGSGISGKLVSFLLFSTGGETPRAVPLELVSRLEDMDAKNIEFSGDMPVVQYREGLMRLTTIDGQDIPEEGKCEIIVFNYDGQFVGLIVDEILDIVSAEPALKLTSNDDQFMGSLIIEGKSTDLIDVGNLLSRVLEIESSVEGIDAERHKNSAILFVEDSMFFRNLTVPFLASAGYKVTAVEGAYEALDIISKQHFDLIVTDIEMPKMNGFELASELRKTYSEQELPIIAFTSTMNAEFDTNMRESGINAGALKTEREKLIISISECLDKAKSREAA